MNKVAEYWVCPIMGKCKLHKPEKTKNMYFQAVKKSDFDQAINGLKQIRDACTKCKEANVCQIAAKTLAMFDIR